MSIKTAMGSGGYRGSPAEAEDREEGIKLNGYVVWLATGDPVGKITAIDIDADGDPVFTLEFASDDKPVHAYRDEIKPYKSYLQWGQP